MSSAVPTRLRRRIERRARHRCEYCRVLADDVFWPHEPDHVIARKHGGETTEDNLALACFSCNRAKGSDIASIDPQSGTIVRLFNPRADNWTEHIRAKASGRIEPLTAVARATAHLLHLNTADFIQTRRQLAQCLRWP